jgi:hypothetical protein
MGTVYVAYRTELVKVHRPEHVVRCEEQRAGLMWPLYVAVAIASASVWLYQLA